MRLLIVVFVFGFGFLGLLAWIWFGRRPTVAQFATAHGVAVGAESLGPVQVALRRTYIGRVVGALGGAMLLGAAGLVIGTGVAVGAAFIGLVAGTMVGIALAQHRPSPAVGAVRQASLDARSIRDYAPVRARGWIAATALTTIAASVLVMTTAPVGLGPYTPTLVLAAATLLIIPLGFWLQRRIVEAARDDTDPQVDDALRSAAVLAVHHSVLGVLLCGLVVACIGGVLSQSNWTVVSRGRTVFTAPPGVTSISVDTGLRQAHGPGAPIRVYWIEADGSEHRTGLLPVTGDPTTSSRLAPVGQLLGWVMLLAIGAALYQWCRATTASRRPPTRARSVALVASA